MKIINREQFIKLQRPVLFAKFEPSIFGDLQFKFPWPECEIDFLSKSIADSIPLEAHHDSCNPEGLIERAINKGESIPIDLDECGRDALFEKEMLFAVWEDEDILKLIKKLKTCLSANCTNSDNQ